MTLPGIPHQIMDQLSDASAVVDQEGGIVYANAAFETLFLCRQDCEGVALRKELQSLDLFPFGAESGFITARVLTPLTGKRSNIFVYLLNTPKTYRHYFIIAKSEEMSERLVNSTLGQLETPSQQLSPEFKGFVGEDPHIIGALYTAQRVANSDLPVLINGESGTGKEILARTIHQISLRSKQEFVDVNCAAMPDNLLESELFGYEKGAFTGARKEGKKGLFDEAHCGTIFLDEIGDASPQVQAKLLRVLQDGCFKRVGGNRNVKVNVRLISATNKDLGILIAESQFRDDLLYRVNTVTITLPPLRNRQKDILLLANHFLVVQNEKREHPLRFSPECLKILKSYHWPGNVRELKGVVDYLVVMATSSVITTDCLPNFLTPAGYARKEIEVDRVPHPSTGSEKVSSDFISEVHRFEKDLIKKVLMDAKNRSEAIKTLGISRRTFYNKIKQYGLDHKASTK